MVRDVEGRGIADHLKGALYLFRIRTHGLEGHRQQEQEIVPIQNLVELDSQAAREIDALSVVPEAVMVAHNIISADHVEELGSLRHLVWAFAPAMVKIHQAHHNDVLPAVAVAVAPHHCAGQPLHADRGPDRGTDVNASGPRHPEPRRPSSEECQRPRNWRHRHRLPSLRVRSLPSGPRMPPSSSSE